MFYFKFKKLLAAAMVSVCTVAYIPNNTVTVLATYDKDMPTCSSANIDILPNTIVYSISGSSSAIDTNTTSGAAIDTNVTSGSSISTTPASGSSITPTTPAALSISVPKKASLYPNEKKLLKVTVKNNSTKVKKTFTSKKPSIVKINSNGKMAAKKAGTTTIVTKISVNGKKYKKKTKVTVINAYLVFRQATVLMRPGQTYQFKIKRYNINKAVTWSVNNSKVASITKKTGKLHAKSRGSVLVTATCGSLQNSVYVSIR